MRAAFIGTSPEHAITARNVSKENQRQRRAEGEQVIIKVPCKCPEKQHGGWGVGEQAWEPEIAEFQCQLYHLVLPLGKLLHFSEQTVLTNIVFRCK